MTETETKEALQRRLAAFEHGELAHNARALFDILGYRSEKRIDLSPNTAGEFRATFDAAGRLNPLTALLDQWQSVDVLFQLTDEELRGAAGGQLPFAAMASPIDNAIIQSYLFIAIALERERYTRTQLAGITREVNKLFPMPVLILFRHGQSLTFAVINRRLNKKDADRDVLEKVTLIKDIAFAQPHRAHLEILFDLSLDELAAKHGFTNFVELHRAWQKTLDTSELNKKFFREVANWYYWAVDNVTFPPGAGDDPETRHAVSVIRLITRLIFVWFIKEKGLVPPELFDKRALDRLLKWNDARGSTYYKAVLQNLFFATLNTDMEADKPGSRRFRGKNESGRDAHYGITNVYRYQDCFVDPDAALALFANVPFLNGGLFECLDRAAEGVRIDGFSDRPDNPLIVPDYLFFGSERKVDLNEVFATRNKQYEVCGLLRIFDRYKFTIEENTPIEEEIALDPELLGKVFENLLAAYNPETGATARKQTGSFYTPRPIVEYMVDESLLAYLQTRLRPAGQGEDDTGLRDRLADLLAYTDRPHGFDEVETSQLIAAIDSVKVLDPACGSGAFPMGVLHKLVYLLGKLDPENSGWRELQRRKAVRETEDAYRIGERDERQRRLLDIEEAFERNSSDYGRKLYLIENCIYGVDIQPIAVQIAKLRFFISLVVDQKIDETRPNRGIRPLPNLETKFVAANTLIGISRPQQLAFRNPAIEQKEAELAEVRRRHFAARTQATKEKYRERDRRLRRELAELLRADGWGKETAAQLAAWDPYDQNAHADFFDPEWMFGVTDGFDVVIENPPYGAEIPETQKRYLVKRHEEIVERIRNSFLYFIGESYRLAKGRGVVCLILPNEFLFQIYMTRARRYFLTNARFLFAVNLGEDVFDAIVPTCIVAFTKEQREGHSIPVADLRHGTLSELPALLRTSEFAQLSSRIVLSAPNAIFSFDVDISSLVNKLAARFQAFENYCDDIANGISTGYDDVYIVSAHFAQQEHFETEYLHECIRGGQFHRYYCPPHTSECILYITSSFRPAAGKNIYRYLQQHKSTLIKKGVEKRTGKRDWHVLFRSRYEGLFASPKILFRQTGDRIIACVDETVGYYCIDSVNVAQVKVEHHKDLYFLLGLLNSRLVNFFYRQISQEGGRVLAQVKPQRIRALPISYGDGHSRDLVESASRQVSAAKSQNPAADVGVLEAEIDQLVYALYGLTPEEIRIVEEGTR